MSYLVSTTVKGCFPLILVDSFAIGVRYSLVLELRLTFLVWDSGCISGVKDLSRNRDFRDKLFHLDINISLLLFALSSFMIQLIIRRLVIFQCVNNVKYQNMLNPN